METIQNLIDKALVREDRARSGKYSPSSFGMCYRQQYWNRKDETKSDPPTARDLRVFGAGTIFHNFVQDLICAENNCQREVLIECEDVKGYADIVRDNEVIDLKTVHSKSFWWLAKKVCDIKKEKYNNWLQVGYYARELNKDFMRLVLISKDDLCINEYVQPFDDYWLTEIENELDMLRDFWRLDLLPDAKPRCIPNKSGVCWQCAYCGWETKCRQVEAEAGREHPSKLEKEKEE